MWFAKKQEMGGKSDDDKRAKQVRSPEKSLQHNINATRELPGGSSLEKSVAPSDGKARGQSADVLQTLKNVRQKPLIQLPQKPQLPLNTKRLNPHYTYKTIRSITARDLTRSIEQSVNIFGVVHEIIKPLSTTKRNKFMLVCVLIDDSDNGRIKFHFFTPEDTTIKQIELGDIVRLHRVKLESFNGEIDGRVFQSQDVVVFKKNSLNITPITTAKSTVITEDEKRRVETLRNWYTEYLRRPTLLSDICQSGRYTIFCKVVMNEPIHEENMVRIRVTDGSAIMNLVPSMPLQRYKRKDGKKEHMVTELIVYNNLDEYARLKQGDFVLFFDVDAVPVGEEEFCLEIHSETSPEICVDKNLQVADIECRIEQFWKSLGMNKNDQINNKTSADNNGQEDDLEIIKKTIPGSSGQENESSVQTRQQKIKQKTSPAKSDERTVPSKCDNKSSTKDDSDGKNTESDQGTKSRKQLFTPNYMTDLSDAATDETSEHNLEISKHNANKAPDEDVVNPANTNFNDIVEKVKTKYCTPKRQGQQSMSQDDEDVNRRSSIRKSHEDNRVPVVMLERLSGTGSEGNSVSRENGNRKRSVNVSSSQEDIEDAETIINISQHTGFLIRSRELNKRTRLESLSTEEGILRTNDAEVDHELENRGQKVSSWLNHPNNRLVTSQQEDIANDEFDVAVIKQILSYDNDTMDMSKYISSVCFRIQGFLLEIIPDPSLNPFDLVSGFCLSGCQQVFLYSSIKWQQEENASIPLCPECMAIEEENELQLMLMMQLVIMDPNGRHGEVLVARNQAEQFLNCSVAEFVKDELVRKSRVQLLMDYTVQNTYHSAVTPLLDIAISPTTNSSTYVLVNSTLKLPRI